MNNLNTYITEKLKIDKNTKSKKMPKIGKIAIDYGGDEWEILDFCYFKDKNKLQTLIKKYDTNGGFADLLEDEYYSNYINDNQIAVAAKMIEDGDVEMWIWGYDGLYFKE